VGAVAFDPDGRAYLHIQVKAGTYEIWRSPTPDRW
jgi:hypothetical protein